MAAAPVRTQGRRAQVAGGNFAQLLSKFEVLDAVSTMEPSPMSFQSYGSFTQSCSNLSMATRRQSTLTDSSFRSIKQAGNSSSGDSSFIPSGTLTPSRRQSSRLHRSSTPTPENLTASGKDSYSCSRQKSVAERRKVFEPNTLPSITSTSARTSIHAPISTKLAHSKSCQSLQIKQSFPAWRRHDTSSTPSTASTITGGEQYNSGGTRISMDNQLKRELARRSLDVATALTSGSSTVFREHQVGRNSLSEANFSKEKGNRFWNLPPLDTSTKRYASSSPKRSLYVPNESSTTLASLSQTPSIANMSPRTSMKETVQSSGIPRPSWSKTGQEIALSPSSSRPSVASRHQSPTRPCRQQSKGDSGSVQNTKMSTPIATAASAIPIASRPGISSLRQKFDLPKSVTTSSMSFVKKKRRETTSPKPTASGKLLQLRKSATTPILGALSPNHKARNRGLEKGVSGPGDPAFKSPGNWATKKEESPLKDKIGLFESLDQQGRIPKASSIPLKSPVRKKPSFRDYRRKLSRAGKSLQIKGTLRRLSASWRRGSSEQSMNSRDPFPLDDNKTNDTWWVKRDGAAKKAAFPQLSPNPAEFGSSSASGTDRLQPSVHCPSSRETDVVSQRKAGLSVCPSLTNRGYNVDGEGGSQVAIPKPPPLPKITHPRFYLKGSYRNRPPAVSEDFGTRRSSSSSTIEDLKQTGSNVRARRRISRSFGPFVASSSCTIEQPRPIRANELKRLVSLCKERVVQRISSGQGRGEQVVSRT